jgi:hypothetical protein
MYSYSELIAFDRLFAVEDRKHVAWNIPVRYLLIAQPSGRPSI